MKTMQLADLHDYGAMEEGEKEFIQVKGFGIDFDVRMPLHYTVIIIKRKSLYFTFIKMFNYLSNCYFETKNNAFPIGCFYPAFACHVVCVYFFCSHGGAYPVQNRHRKRPACIMFYVVTFYVPTLSK